MKGKERPTVKKAKTGDPDSTLAGLIADGLRPYLKGTLITIGRAAAGPKNMGGGNLQAALGAVRLLMDAQSASGGEDAVLGMIKRLREEAVSTEEDESEYYDDPEGEDLDLEILNDEIDALTA